MCSHTAKYRLQNRAGLTAPSNFKLSSPQALLTSPPLRRATSEETDRIFTVAPARGTSLTSLNCAGTVNQGATTSLNSAKGGGDKKKKKKVHLFGKKKQRGEGRAANEVGNPLHCVVSNPLYDNFDTT